MKNKQHCHSGPQATVTELKDVEKTKISDEEKEINVDKIRLK